MTKLSIYFLVGAFILRTKDYGSREIVDFLATIV